MTEGLLIGVDAGGTSTKTLAFDPVPGESRTARAEGANWTVHGPDLCRERLGAAVAGAAAGCPIRSLALCIAGYYPPDHREAAEAWARATWPDVPHLSIQTDVHAAWAGAFGGEPGIVVISGTGSIAYGRNAAGEEARAGGWGPLFDDFGSAYHLGILTLRRMALEVDLGPSGVRAALFDHILAEWSDLGTDLRSWLRGVYRVGWGREQVAALGGFIARAADEGDDQADTLVLQCSVELVEIAGRVNRRLHSEAPREPLPVALHGGLGEHCRTLRRYFRNVAAARSEELYEYRMSLADSRFSPLEGAVILAAQATGEEALKQRSLEALR